jgi:hypothetical protein
MFARLIYCGDQLMTMMLLDNMYLRLLLGYELFCFSIQTKDKEGKNYQSKRGPTAHTVVKWCLLSES